MHPLTILLLIASAVMLGGCGDICTCDNCKLCIIQ